MTFQQVPGEAVSDGPRIVLMGGQDNAGIARAWRIDGERVAHIKLHGIGNTAFGELPVAEPTPVVQLQWPYNVNSRITESRPNQSGTVTQASNLLRLQTGTAADSSAQALSKRILAYRPGQGGLVRFTAVFTTGVANNTQWAGIGDSGDGFFFGFNGTTFSTMIRSGGLPEIRTLTITVAAGESDDITITLDGDTKSVSVTDASADKTITANEIAAGDYSDTGRGWTAVARGDTVAFTSWDSSSRTGTYDVTDATSADGTYARTVAGVAPTETVTAQTAWNGDPADSNQALPTLDPTKGNVYQIRYQWLGFGAVEFSVESPTTGIVVLVHRVAYANANTVPIIRNPSLPLCAIAENVSNTSNITLDIGSMGGFIEGRRANIGPRFSVTGTNAAIAATEIPLLSIANKGVYQSRVNRTIVMLDDLFVAADATRNLTFTVRIGATLTGAAFADVDTNTSVVEIDTTATAQTGGALVGRVVVAKTAGGIISLAQELLPDEVLTVGALASGGTGHDGSAVLGWMEEF